MIFAISMSFTDQFIFVFQSVPARILEIAKAPFLESSMLWILGPMLIAMLLMSFYFGRYKAEELGWNTAFGNSLILIFASVDLLNFLHSQGSLFTLTVQTALVAAIVLEGITLTFLNYFHLLPKSLAFGMSSGMTINVIIMFVIILVYSGLPLDYITAISCALIAALIVIIIRIMQVIQPTAIEDDEDSI